MHIMACGLFDMLPPPLTLLTKFVIYIGEQSRKMFATFSQPSLTLLLHQLNSNREVSARCAHIGGVGGRCIGWKSFLEALWAPLIELELVHCPHGALYILNAHETLVETQVVTDGILNVQQLAVSLSHQVRSSEGALEDLRADTYLPSGRIPSKVAERCGEPVINFV